MSRELHPVLTPGERQRLIELGVDLFNRGRFYDCHEAFEEIWRSTTPEPRDLFQGLIQVAVGLHHHLVRKKSAAGRRVLGRGLKRLAPFRPTAFGFDLEALCTAAERWNAWLAEPAGEPPPLPRIAGLRDPSAPSAGS